MGNFDIIISWEKIVKLRYLTTVPFCYIFPAYAIAELIDNALSATVKNKELRAIEIRMVCFTGLYHNKNYI